MSVDEFPDAVQGPLGELPDTELDAKEGPKPRAHGSSVQNVFADAEPGPSLEKDRGTLYERAIDYWRERVGSRDAEPHVVDLEQPLAEVAEWLPPARGDREHVVVLTSSRWKAGTGVDDAYSAYYQQHLKLRERDPDGELHNPPTSLHVEIMPQFDALLYPDGTPLKCQHGEGTRLVAWTTWAQSGEAVEQRMYDVVRAVYGDDALNLGERVEQSRRIAKAEAHVRFDIEKKARVVDAIGNSEELIAYGGRSEIEAHQQRQREGWLEAAVDADRWQLLGFDGRNYSREVKIYQRADWADLSPQQSAHHPKLEASFAGVNDGQLPHVGEWDSIMQDLRELVSAHLEWAGVDRDDLVADDYFAGPGVESYEFDMPQGRREQLRERYESVATEVYREALKHQTDSLYDILRVLTSEDGATYDVLEDRTGLARSTIRYHCRRLEENGVVERIGNPRLIVFPSLAVLERATEIMRQIKPEETAQDMRERADERRESRESDDTSDDAGDAHQEDSDDGVDDAHQEGSDGRPEWVPLDELDAVDGDRLGTALERELVAARDVQLNVDPYDWLPDR